MSSSNDIRIILWIFLVITKGHVVRGQVAGPNAVALINGQTMLDCTIAFPTSSWIHTTDGTNNPLMIAVGCIVVGNNSAYYRTELLGGNICRLVIANVTMQQAGVYLCNDGFSTTYRSLVTVIDPVANVVVHNQSAEVVDADLLNISCSINYNGPASPAPSLRPSPYWTTSPGQIFTNDTYHPSINVVTLIATVAVQKPSVPIFQCNINFSITGNTTNYNATPPADNLSPGATTELDVQYGIGRVYVSYSTDLDGEVHLTCNTTGNPPPNYFWTGPSDITNISQPTIQIYTPDYYECNATNVIREEIHSNSSGINITEDYFPLPPSPSPSAPSAFPSTTLSPDPSNSSQVYNGSDVATTATYVAVAISVYEIANLISMIFFLIFYNMDTDANTNVNNSKVASNKKAFNNRFPWLEMMLPCMNESNENCGKRCLWIFFFSIITISCGVFIFPILVIIVMCCGKDLHGSQENSHLNLRMDDISVSMTGENNRFRPPPSSLPPASPSSHAASVQRLPIGSAGSQRPPPPPNKPMRPPPPPAMTHQMNREGGAVEYAFLPMARRPHLAPAQYLDDDETSHYAILRRV